jgi:hypothetical protein
MRTKTLLLTAALSAAGVATSMAQVYSVNAVGYVNTALKPGYNLISNPLIAANNTIGNLFKDLPDGTQVYKYDGTRFATATKDETYLPTTAANLNVMPGEGVFVKLPASATAGATVTFVGEVPQGTLTIDLPKGLSIRSSIVPQAGTADALGLPAQDGDQFYQFDPATQKYRTSTYDGGWFPALAPLKVGEAFFLKRVNAGTWTRTFSVNQ